MQAWLRAELHTKDELERLLVNVGTSVRLGFPHPLPRQPGAQTVSPQPTVAQPQQASHDKCRVAPVMPEQLLPLATSQVAASTQAVSCGPAAQLAVGDGAKPPGLSAGAGMASPQPASQGTEAASTTGSDWRSMLDASLNLFEERYNKLQQELAMVKQQGGQATNVQQ